MSRFMLNLRQIVEPQGLSRRFHYTSDSDDVLSSIIGNIGATLDHFGYDAAVPETETQLGKPTSSCSHPFVDMYLAGPDVPSV